MVYFGRTGLRITNPIPPKIHQTNTGRHGTGSASHFSLAAETDCGCMVENRKTEISNSRTLIFLSSQLSHELCKLQAFICRFRRIGPCTFSLVAETIYGCLVEIWELRSRILDL